jgi:single-strand DNA-binding protein
MSSRSLNRILLIGNLTRDPELKYTPAGTAVCSFSVATNRSWTTTDGQTKEEVQYHRIVAWQKLAELCGKLLTKGRKVFLEGRMTYRTYTGKDSIQRTVAEIILDDFIVFGDGKRAVATEAGSPAPVEETKAEVPAMTEEKPKDQKSETNDETVNPDDIPF